MIIEKLSEAMRAKEGEIQAFINKHGLLTNPNGGDDDDQADASPSEKKSQGVLV